MNKHIITAKGDFFTRIAHSHDQKIASAAERMLREHLGIDPKDLEHHAEGNNTLVYSFRDKIAIKVVSNVENHQREIPEIPQIPRNIRQMNLGYDHGGAAINLHVAALLDTASVTSQHTAALCHELYTRHGLVLHDNKLENVGLDANGTPYMVDTGAWDYAPPEKHPEFRYPENSGFDANTGAWREDVARHSFTWPERDQQFPELVEFLESLQNSRGR